MAGNKKTEQRKVERKLSAAQKRGERIPENKVKQMKQNVKDTKK